MFDRVRTCDNHCPFCFIYQLPPGMRKSLYLKDDDYRLSFLYGNFTTLTRFTEADLERVLTEGLSPLYVSIHATDPDLRARLLRNRRGATSLRWLAALLDAGVEVHGQVVVCPGVNDGDALDDTLLGVLDRFPRLATVGVVPLGVSDYSTEPEMRVHTPAEAAAVLDAVERWQGRFADALGRRLVYAADEYYLMAGRPFPVLAEYDDVAQHENGIGMAVTFADEVARAARGDVVAGTGPRSGFFASVEGAPAAGYRAPRDRRGRARGASTRTASAPVGIVTGEYGAQVLAPLLPDAPGGRGRSRCGCSRSPTASSAATSRSPGCSPRPTSATRSRASRPGTATCSPTWSCPTTGSSTEAASADLPRPSRVVRTDGASLVRRA